MDQDIYAPPKSELVDATQETLENLASRWKRFWASIVDMLTITAVTVPVMYFTGGFENISQGTQPSTTYNLLIGLLGILVFIALNTKLLVEKGQTIGKAVLNIKIVNHEDNDKITKKQLLKRYATYMIPGQIPVAGQLFSLVNILFIFGKPRRCLHDHIANTKVVTC